MISSKVCDLLLLCFNQCQSIRSLKVPSQFRCVHNNTHKLTAISSNQCPLQKTALKSSCFLSSFLFPSTILRHSAISNATLSITIYSKQSKIISQHFLISSILQSSLHHLMKRRGEYTSFTLSGIKYIEITSSRIV